MSTRNDQLFQRAQKTIPAGVNSPVRAFRAVGGTPRFFTRAEGAYRDTNTSADWTGLPLRGPGEAPTAPSVFERPSSVVGFLSPDASRASVVGFNPHSA